MIEEKDYMALESKIICVQCGNHFYLQKDNGKLILQCMGCYECPESSCNAPLITWDDLADAVNSASTIVDLHLDFLCFGAVMKLGQLHYLNGQQPVCQLPSALGRCVRRSEKSPRPAGLSSCSA